jgi:hypothetical protein
MIAGMHFPALLHPSYDPECLLSGHEAHLGLTYTNSKRDWPSESLYQDACHRLLPPEEILRMAPRRLIDTELTRGSSQQDYPQSKAVNLGSNSSRPT